MTNFNENNQNLSISQLSESLGKYCPDYKVRPSGDKISLEKKDQVNKIISDLKDLLKGDNKSDIEIKTNLLNQMSIDLFQDINNSNSNSNNESETDQTSDNVKKDDVVDADYEEIKDNKNKKEK